MSQSCDKEAIYLDNAAGSTVPSVREDTQQHCCLNGKQTAQCHQSPARERNVTISPTCNLRCHHGYVFVRSCFGLHMLFTPPLPLCSNKHRDKLCHPSDLLFPLLTLSFSPSGVRGTNSAGGFNCATCWWRHCRG